MKTLKIILTLIVISSITYSCETDSDITQENKDAKWWILTHKNYESPGIYLFNETNLSVELKLDLPEGLDSPHALTYDGKSLWIGGMGSEESIYELNPETGEIISEIKNIRTEGLASSNDFLYYSSSNKIYKIKKDGSIIDVFTTENSSHVIPDIAVSENNLYYLRYSEEQPIVELNLSTKQENIIPNIENAGTYCLSFHNNKLITINNSNKISSFDSKTGEFINDITTNISGWITAIEPY